MIYLFGNILGEAAGEAAFFILDCGAGSADRDDLGDDLWVMPWYE